MVHQTERLISAIWFGLMGYVAGIGVSILFSTHFTKNDYFDDIVICLLPFFIVSISSIGYSALFKYNKFKIARLSFLIAIISLGLVSSSIQVYYYMITTQGSLYHDVIWAIVYILGQGLITLSVAAFLGFFFGYKILLTHTSFNKSLGLGFAGGTLGYFLYIFISFPLMDFIADPHPAASVNELLNYLGSLFFFSLMGYFAIGWVVSLIGVIAAMTIYRIRMVLTQ